MASPTLSSGSRLRFLSSDFSPPLFLLLISSFLCELIDGLIHLSIHALSQSTIVSARESFYLEFVLTSPPSPERCFNTCQTAVSASTLEYPGRSPAQDFSCSPLPFFQVLGGPGSVEDRGSSPRAARPLHRTVCSPEQAPCARRGVFFHAQGSLIGFTHRHSISAGQLPVPSRSPTLRPQRSPLLTQCFDPLLEARSICVTPVHGQHELALTWASASFDRFPGSLVDEAAVPLRVASGTVPGDSVVHCMAYPSSFRHATTSTRETLVHDLELLASGDGEEERTMAPSTSSRDPQHSAVVSRNRYWLSGAGPQQSYADVGALRRQRPPILLDCRIAAASVSSDGSGSLEGSVHDRSPGLRGLLSFLSEDQLCVWRKRAWFAIAERWAGNLRAGLVRPLLKPQSVMDHRATTRSLQPVACRAPYLLLPACPAGRLSWSLTVDLHPLATPNPVVLSVRNTAVTGVAFGILVDLESARPLEQPANDKSTLFSNNLFMLLPGEEERINITTRRMLDARKTSENITPNSTIFFIYVSGWNVKPSRLGLTLRDLSH